MSDIENVCLMCPQKKWIRFAFESQGEEPPVIPPTSGWHEFDPAPTGTGRISLPLIKNVVWLDPAVELKETTQGKPLTHFSEALAVTIHRTAEIEYMSMPLNTPIGVTQ
jgi:hypothetical protein